jgi:5-methylcytosine-specific restriction endonuclease McrA
MPKPPSPRNPVAGKRCTYCGDPATDIDHVPPKSLVAKWRLPITMQEVPACDFCNRTLSNRAALMTLPARKAWMKASLWRKRMPHKRREGHGVEGFLARARHAGGAAVEPEAGR